MEVDTSWLLSETSPALQPPKPPRRETMEVKLEWLEEVAPKKRALPPPLPREDPSSEPPPSRRSQRPRAPSKKPPAPPPLPQREVRRVVPHEAWVEARVALLAKEKELTRLGDELARARRELPWEAVTERYVFETPRGRATLGDLFGKRTQLVVYHFMFDPTKGAACRVCSFWADNFDGTPIHLAQRDVAFVAVSRAPLAKIEAFKKRMGWSFDWVSCGEEGRFNRDFQASFTPREAEHGAVYNYVKQPVGGRDREAISVFYKDPAGAVFHTYSAYARGVEALNAAYRVLDLVPKGRDEGAGGASWVRHHDRYE